MAKQRHLAVPADRAIKALLFAGAVAVTFLPPLARQTLAGEWIADARGCRVWNPNPSAQEAVSWSGSCKDGFAEGEGVVEWSRNGLPYERNEGAWRRGRQGGHALQVWTTGRYEGEVRDGIPHGHGILVIGEARYEGEFSDGKPNGEGVLRNANGIFDGTWKSGCFRRGREVASIGVDIASCH